MDTMKYYVIEIAEGDAKIAGKGTYEFANAIEAKASFHKKLGTAMSSELFTSDLVMVINSEGGILASEKYTKEVVETPVVEEEPEA